MRATWKKRDELNNGRKNVITYFDYQIELLMLLLHGDIKPAQWRRAAWERPAAICGRNAIFVIGPSFGMDGARRAVIFTAELIAGLLLIAGGIGYAAYLIQYESISALFGGHGLATGGVLLFGTVLAIEGGGMGTRGYSQTPIANLSLEREHADTT